MTLKNKEDKLNEILQSCGRAVIAYSGGVDSNFLLYSAKEALTAENVLAVIGISPSLSQYQLDIALKNASDFGVELVKANVEELKDGRYSKNDSQRCFYCKSALFTKLWDIADQRGFDSVLCGSNLDDMDDYRPGNKAAEKLNVYSPLMLAGLTKSDIRTLSRNAGLSTADMPASPCLSSRLAYGVEITADKLKQIEDAENFLRSLGFIEFRVRHHGDLARIEVAENDFDKITSKNIRKEISKQLKELGFKFISIDINGFRSGSLNSVLKI